MHFKKIQFDTWQSGLITLKRTHLAQWQATHADGTQSELCNTIHDALSMFSDHKHLLTPITIEGLNGDSTLTVI